MCPPSTLRIPASASLAAATRWSRSCIALAWSSRYATTPAPPPLPTASASPRACSHVSCRAGHGLAAGLGGSEGLRCLDADVLQVHLEVQLDRTPTIGNFLDKVEWDDNAKSFACSATDGYLYVHELLD